MTTVALPMPRPSLTLLGTEPWRAALEFISHQLGPRPARRNGDGHRVIIFPGLGADGASVTTLRDHCRALGYDASDWGRGFNSGPSGPVDAWLASLAQHVQGLIDEHDGRPATLIGWSLGGLYARELGKLLAPKVRQVITIAAPFNADRDFPNVGWLLKLLGGIAPICDFALSERLRVPPPVPTTSIYSRSDGVVGWQACTHGTAATQVEDVEVQGSHIGMGWNPDVLRVVENRLEQASGDWRPYCSKL